MPWWGWLIAALGAAAFLIALVGLAIWAYIGHEVVRGVRDGWER